MSDANLNELYRLALQQLQMGVILTDPEGNILFVNDAAESIRNIHRETVMGNSVVDCHRTESKEKVVRSIDFLKKTRTDPSTAW